MIQDLKKGLKLAHSDGWEHITENSFKGAQNAQAEFEKFKNTRDAALKFYTDVGDHVEMIKIITDVEQEILQKMTKYNEKTFKWEYIEEKISNKWHLHEDKDKKEKLRPFFPDTGCCSASNKAVEKLDTPTVQKKLNSEMSKLEEISKEHAIAKTNVRVNQEKIDQKKTAIITNVYQLQYVLELLQKQKDHLVNQNLNSSMIDGASDARSIKNKYANVILKDSKDKKSAGIKDHQEPDRAKLIDDHLKKFNPILDAFVE